ncbi:thioredoxin family protein [Microbaculum marinum]|uniref:Thioredoxin family protein n=1 Tax=Microbaculum marinum TaxID=1764581 RepID=A0AAW9RXD9_9HYPH
MPMILKIVTFALATVMAVPAVSAELLMFEEDGCIWCARWDAEVAPAYARSEEGRVAPLVRIDLRRDPLPDTLQLNGRVRYTPTFVLVDGGREVGRITGYPGEDAFWGLLDELIGNLDQGSPPPLDSARSIPAPLPQAEDVSYRRPAQPAG